MSNLNGSSLFWPYMLNRWVLTALLALLWQTAQPQARYDSLDLLLEQAKAAVTATQYSEALRIYSYILAQNNVVKGEVAFFMGRSLYEAYELRSAKQFLNFYIQKSQRDTSHRAETQALLLKLEAQLHTIDTCRYCNTSGYRTVSHQVSSEATSVCPKCRGQRYNSCGLCYTQGLIIGRDAFEKKVFNKCTRCAGKGYTPCNYCQGQGIIKVHLSPSSTSKKICMHHPSQ